MLSVGKVTTSQGGYYLEAVAHGREDYYTKSGEVPGRWLGAGSVALGLDGEVDDQDFIAVLAGVSPRDGERLCRSNRRVSGLDLTLSAPKSVSVLWALASSSTTTAVAAAHDAAIEATVAFLERTAVKARRGHNGVDQVDGEGLITAAFRHRTSRAGDPQLHTHVVVANATHCGDGSWRTLDARWIYGYARTAGFLYQTELRRQLTARLGVSWSDVDKGVAEIAGIDRSALREFSRRRIEIEHALGTGPSSVGAARTAALRTRPAKAADSFESLLTDWRTRAEALGADVEGAVVQSPSPPPSTELSAAPTEVDPLELGEELCTNQAVFDRRDVLRALTSRAVSGARPADVEAAADRFLTEESVVELTSDRFGPRFTTTAQLALEDRLLRRALDGVGAGTGRCWEERSPDDDLSDEQAAMVEAITTDGNDVSVVVGVAGSGKTHALRHAAHAWRSEEFEVIGCALAARAAANLEEGAAIAASTIERLLGDLGAGRRHLTNRSVVIVDEAAMVGTPTIARLLDQTTCAVAKLVLVGDHRQLPEIEAGGAFAALAHALSSATLITNRRQDDPEDRRILAELRHGDPTAAWQGLERRDRIRSFEHDDRAKQQMVEDWFAATRRGSAAVMLALDRSDVDDLNLLARQRMKAHHRLGLAELVVEDLPFAVGDRVVALRNRYDLGLLNGDAGTVRSIHPGTHSLHVQLDRGTGRRVPMDYLADGHLNHGYATTIHKAQGLTCDEAFVYADESIYREAGYTALSRARHEKRLYLATSDHSSRFSSPFGRSRAQRLASAEQRTNRLNLQASNGDEDRDSARSPRSGQVSSVSTDRISCCSFDLNRTSTNVHRCGQGHRRRSPAE